jgi:PAS domain S-box-containing protein
MEEKSVMTKSGKASRKKPTTEYQLAHIDPQVMASQKLFDAIPLAIVSVDWEGHIQYMNKAAKSLLGESSERFKLEEWPQKFGLLLDDGILPFPESKLPLIRALRGETGENAEEMILRRDGNENGIWISMSAETLRDENGNIEGAIALIRDINYRKQIEFSQNKHVRRIEALYKFSRAVAEAGNELNKITRLAVDFVVNEIGDFGLLTLLNSNGDKLRITAFHDSSSKGQALLRKFLVPGYEYDPDQSLSGGVIRSGQPTLIPSIPSEQLKVISLPAFQEFIQEIGIQSVLIVPLVGRSGVVGTINVLRHRDSNSQNL